MTYTGPDAKPAPPRERIPLPAYLAVEREVTSGHYKLTMGIDGIRVAYAEAGTRRLRETVSGEDAVAMLERDAVEHGLELVPYESTTWPNVIGVVNGSPARFEGGN